MRDICPSRDDAQPHILDRATGHCALCGTELRPEAGRSSSHRLTRYERHALAADNGCDTWEDYRGEK